jgi:hypothetical protein
MSKAERRWHISTNVARLIFLLTPFVHNGRLAPWLKRKLIMFAASCCGSSAELGGEATEFFRHLQAHLESRADGLKADTAPVAEPWPDLRDELGDPSEGLAAAARFARVSRLAGAESAAAVIDWGIYCPYGLQDDPEAYATEKLEAGYDGYVLRKHLAQEQAAQQIHLIREIVGNPFRRPTVQQAWLRWNDGTVPRIAQGIYEERAFDRLPILHDALLDAGCDNEDILAHCRGAGPHVRGCWALDLLLAKP